MSIFLWILFFWVLSSVGLLLLIHGRELIAVWQEPVLGHPVLIVESDDWGPGPASDGHALLALADLLDGIRDRTGRPVVMTLGVVLALPDGPAILSSGGKSYVRRSLAEPEYLPIVEAIDEGCGRGVFFLQRHGLEHYWPDVLLAHARQNAEVREWLARPDGRTESLSPAIQSRWVNAAQLPSRPHGPVEVRQAVRDEAALFSRVFGCAPEVAVPNTFVWDECVEAAWSEHGVRCVITPGVRYTGRSATGRLVTSRRRIRNGDRGAGGVMYLVRNDYFEPVRGHDAEQVWAALAAKVAQGRPVLLEMHRENFIVAQDSTSSALTELERALRGARERYPDIRFLSTIDLLDSFDDQKSPLRERSHLHRLQKFLRRIRCDAVGARLVKFTGLGWVMKLAEQLLGAVARLLIPTMINR